MSGRLEGKVALISGDLITENGTPYLDVTDEESVEALVQGAVDTHGRIDILYNNAGAVRFGSIEEQSFADWRLTPAAELDPIFLACRHAWSHLKARSPCGASAPPSTSFPRRCSSAATRPPTSPEPTLSSTAAGRLCSLELGNWSEAK